MMTRGDHGDRGDRPATPPLGWRWLRLRWVAVYLAAAALLAAILDLPAEHRDYVAARLLLDAIPNPPFHLPAPADHAVMRTVPLGQPTTAATAVTDTTATAASLWLPSSTRRSRLPGIVIVTGAAPLGRNDPQAMQLARALARAGRSVLVPDLALRTSSLSGFNFGVEMFELDAGVLGGEAPVDPTTGGVALRLPGGDLPFQACPVGQAAVQALAGEHAE